MAKKHQTYRNEPPKPYRVGALLSRIFCGIAFLVAATILLLGVFDVIELSVNTGIIVAISALGIIAIASLFRLMWGGFFFLSATIITIMNANGMVFSLDGQAIGSLFIAAALLTIAFHIIFRGKRHHWKHSGPHSDATFSTTVKHFEGDVDSASLDCDFGTVKAYFTDSAPKNNQFNLNIDCNFGGVELHVPKEWKVIDHTHAAFGATNEKNHSAPDKDAPTLTITGEVNFGGITIIYS